MSEKVTNLIEEVKSLTVLELSELVKALEEEFGVSAAANDNIIEGIFRRGLPLPLPLLPLLKRRPSSTLC